MILEYITTTVILLITIAILWLINYSLSIHRNVKRYSHIPGLTTTGIKEFFLGDIPKIIEQDKKGLSMSQYLASLTSVYGNTFKYRLLNNVFIFSIDPKIVKEIYIELNFSKPKKTYHFVGFPGGERYLGKGLLTETDHGVWKKRRALFNPGFHRSVLMKFMNEFNQKADILINFLKTKADGKTEIVLLDQFNHTTLDIIASVAFNMKLDTVNDPTNKFNEYIFSSLSNLKHYFRDPFIKLNPFKRGFINQHRHAIRYLRKTGRDQILARLDMIKNNKELPNDILTTILQTHENEEFDIESMVDDFVTFFIAGQETTATTLSSLFLELGRNNDALEKLKTEIDTIIGHNNEISYEDLHELKYTGACIKEALRLWPPAPQITRISNKQFVTENYVFPAETLFSTNVYASGRNEQFWENALKFKPERFLNNNTDSENTVSKYVYYPFSLGPRNCIGQNFAQIEAKVIIAKFIQNLDFKLSPNQSFVPIQAGTLRPKDGTKCFLTLRY